MANLSNFYRGKRVFITGHTGFKGAWLSEWLLQLGATVTGYSIDIPTQPSLCELLAHPRRLKHQLGDVRQFETLFSALKAAQPEIVFHMAAQPLVRLSYDDPKTTFETNILGTVNLLESLRQLGTIPAAVIVTSDKVYDNNGLKTGYRETDRLGGGDPYSVSKACAELVTSSYHRAFFSGSSLTKIASARAGNVIGGGDFAKDRIVPDCIRAWTQSKSVFLRQPESIRPWQHVLEPLGGYLLLGQRLFENDSNAIGEAFNFGPPIESSKTVRELVTSMQKNFPNAKCENVDQDPLRPESKYLTVNCEKAFEKLGWKPRLSFAETVQLTSDWYMETTSDVNTAPLSTQRQIQEYFSNHA